MGYDNSNSGAMFKSDKRPGHEDTDRDYSGNMEVTCPHCSRSADHWISAWINVSKAGAKYMKLKFNAKDQSAQPSGGRLDKNEDGTTKPPGSEDDGFDDIPF